jgi:hypothetical protein
VVIGVTDEPRNLVDGYVAKNGPKYPIVMESVDSGTTFGLQGGYPTQYVIGPDGKIAWAGNFFDQDRNADEILEKLLKSVRLSPDLPAKLDPFEKLIEKKKFADARAGLAKVAADEKADAGDRKAAEDTVKWIDDGAASALTSAQEDEKAGRIAEAADGYEAVSANYAGLDQAAKAADALKALLADPAKKKEVDGAKALAKAQADIREMAPKKAIPIIKSIYTKYKDTKAGAKAAQLLADLEAKEAKGGR